MRKIILLAIALMLALSPLAVSHSETEEQEAIKKFSDETLEHILSVVSAELISRRGCYTLEPGVYEVGTDIPAGAWRMEMTAGYLSGAYVRLYANADCYYEGDWQFAMLLSEYDNQTVIGRISLSNGNILCVDGTFTVTPYTGAIKNKLD